MAAAGLLLENRRARLGLLLAMLDICQRQKALLGSDDIDGFLSLADEWQAKAGDIGRLDEAYRAALGGAEADGANDADIARADAEALTVVTRMNVLNAELRAALRDMITKSKADFSAGQRVAERAMSYINPYSAVEESIYFDKRR